MEFLQDYWLYLVGGGALVFCLIYPRSSSGGADGWFDDCGDSGGDGGD